MQEEMTGGLFLDLYICIHFGDKHLKSLNDFLHLAKCSDYTSVGGIDSRDHEKLESLGNKDT